MTSIAAQHPDREEKPRPFQPALDASATPEGRAQWRQIGRALDQGATPPEIARRILHTTDPDVVRKVRNFYAAITTRRAQGAGWVYPVRRVLIEHDYYRLPR